jgi:endonuclease III
MNKEKINALFKALNKAIPDPHTELNYKTNFELLIAVLLSAHTTDKSVNKATAKLFPVANTPKKILKLGEERLKQYIKTVGLHNSKAKNMIKTCEILIAKHHGNVPNSLEDLQNLAGVGSKTAKVVMNIAFDARFIPVDTHIFRVANRIGLAQNKNVLLVERKLEEIIPQKLKKNAHHLLLLHGRYVCRAKKPLCKECVIEKYCDYQSKNL